VRLVMCDDHRLFAEPFAAALTLRGHEVLLTTSPAEALRAVDEREPDVCVMDLRFPEADGIAAVAELRRRHPSCPVVVLTGSEDVRDLTAAAEAGASGFLRKGQPVRAIFEALDRVVAGREVLMLPSPTGPAATRGDTELRQLVGHLTSRERQVLRHLVEAEDTRGIARALGVAPSTARTHLQSVLVKLGVHTRLQAVALVVAAGIDREL
jgi:two-component system, NarL family, nitrate/nitrite response regulator NarL